MSKTSERLKGYQTQMSIYAEQHKMILASDVLDMIEQLQDDLKDDVDKVVAELEKNQEGLETDMWARESDNWYGQYCNGKSDGFDEAIDIVKAGGVDD